MVLRLTRLDSSSIHRLNEIVPTDQADIWVGEVEDVILRGGAASPLACVAQIQAITGGGSDYAFDTTGNAVIVRASHAALNNIGTIALAGVGFGDLTDQARPALLSRRLRIDLVSSTAPGRRSVPRSSGHRAPIRAA